MANVKFNKGLLANLPATSTEGALYFTTDESIYLGLAGGGYHRFGDFIEVANVAALPADGAHVKALYYAKAENVLCKWDGSAWVQINLNTTYTIAAGATAGSVKLVGSDNSSVEVQVVDVAGLNSAIAEAKAQADKGIEDAATAQAAAEAAQKTADDLADFVGDIPTGYAEETVIAYINKKAEETLNAASGGSSESAASVLAALNTYKSENDPKVQANTDAITILNGDTADSVGGQIDTAIKELDLENTYEKVGVAKGLVDAVQGDTDATIKSVEESVTAIKDGTTIDSFADVEAALAGKQATGDYATKAEAQGYADAKVASVTAGDTSVTVAGASTAPTVAVKLDPSADNALKLNENGLKVEIGAAPEYSIVKAAESGEFAAVYHLTKDGVNVGSAINIPKDMVVKSGSVVDGNIVLVLNDESNTEITIPADSLIEYVTSGSATGDMVVINVSDDHKVTATITDGTIGLAKLTTEVQTAIGKAHSHENADVLTGITADNVEAWNKAEANAIAKAEELDAAMELRMDAVEEKLATVDKDADVNVIETVKVNGVALTPDENKAVDVTVPTGALASKDKVEETDLADELKAKVHTHDNKALLDTYDQTNADLKDAVAKKHAHANATVLDGISADKVSAWDAAEQNAKDYADGLADNYDASGSAATAEGNAKAYADGLMVWGEF